MVLEQVRVFDDSDLLVELKEHLRIGDDLLELKHALAVFFV